MIAENAVRTGGDDVFFCQAEDGIRDLVRSRGLGDVYKRQAEQIEQNLAQAQTIQFQPFGAIVLDNLEVQSFLLCLLYTSDAADERSSVDLGGRRIIKKKNMGVTCI